MRKLILLLTGLLILMTLSFGSYKNLAPQNIKALLIYDFNANTRNFGLEDFKNLDLIFQILL